MTGNAISMEGRRQANVILLKTLSQNVQIGKLGVEAKCAACHSINAAGQDRVAPPLVHKVYGSSHHGDESFQRASGLGGFNQTKAYCHKYPSHSYRTSQQLNGRSSDGPLPFWSIWTSNASNKDGQSECGEGKSTTALLLEITLTSDMPITSNLDYPVIRIMLA